MTAWDAYDIWGQHELLNKMYDPKQNHRLENSFQIGSYSYHRSSFSMNEKVNQDDECRYNETKTLWILHLATICAIIEGSLNYTNLYHSAILENIKMKSRGRFPCPVKTKHMQDGKREDMVQSLHLSSLNNWLLFYSKLDWQKNV